jgi:small subunit ribosomal protein S3Ae
MVKKRTVDTWKKKKWFEVYADSNFDGIKIADTIAIEGKKLIGRKITKNLKDLTNNIRNSYYEVVFKINKVTTSKADTKLVEFITKNNYLRRTTRKGKSKIEPVFYVKTKDGNKLKIKALFITGAKYTTDTRKEAQKIIVDYLIKDISEKTTTEVWNDIINQNYTAPVKKKLLKLGYVYKFFISKAKLIE